MQWLPYQAIVLVRQWIELVTSSYGTTRHFLGLSFSCFFFLLWIYSSIVDFLGFQKKKPPKIVRTLVVPCIERDAIDVFVKREPPQNCHFF